MNRTKGNKPVCERQIPYDLTYKWNLINKTNKQNITRDIEIKNKLIVTRGEVRGIMVRKGGRVFRNNYKGHMDKTKVGVESRVGSGDGCSGGERWGKNEDNCT